MNYSEMLEHSYSMARNFDECGPQSRLDWLGDQVFDFTTYDSEMSELFARKAIEVCEAINSRTTFDLCAEPETYPWYLVMANMPFFASKLEWGTSVRGAWWGAERPGEQIELHTCGLYINGEQVLDWRFSDDEWKKFVAALIDFAKADLVHNNKFAGSAPCSASDST